MQKNLINKALLLLLGLFFFPSLFAQQTISVPLSYQLPEGAKIWEGRLIFKVKPQYRDLCFPHQLNIPSVNAALGKLKVKGLEKVFPHHQAPTQTHNAYGQELIDLSLIYSLEYDPQLFSINAAVSILNRLPALAYVEPWFVPETMYQPNDYFADTTNGAAGSWHLQMIRAQEAWDIQRNDTNVVIGIVDSGTSFLHPDMQDNLYLNADDPIDGIDNDQDGYIDNYRGWDFGGDSLGEAGDNNASTIFPWHGLGVAGVAAATTDNGVGIAGTGFNCRYLPIKAAPESNIGSIYYGYQGLVYAVDQGCEVVNLSWGSPVPTRFGEDAVNYAAINRQAAVIVAAGNSNSNIRFYPAAFDRAISVAISGPQDSVCCNTTFNHSVDMSAPGIFISSLNGDDDYLGLWQGTSISAPIVAGAVALTLAEFPQYNGAQAAQKVRVSAQPIPHDFNLEDRVGRGRLDMYAALLPDASPSVRTNDYHLVDADGDGRIAAGDTVALDVDFLNYLDPASNLEVTLSIPLQQTPFVRVVENQAMIGPLGTLNSYHSTNDFKVVLSANLPVDFMVDLKFTYSDPNTGYDDFEYVQLRVNPSWLNVEENQLRTTITSKGSIGFNDFQSYLQGIGLLYQSSRNVFAEGSFIIGNSASQISNRFRTDAQNSRDDDFSIVDFVRRNPNPYLADFEASATFNDNGANIPLGVTITQNTFAWDEAEYQKFVILLYEVENEKVFPINNLSAGLFADFDIITQQLNLNRAEYDPNERIIFTYDAQGGTTAHYGLKLLNDGNFYARALGNPNISNFSDQAKYLSLTNFPSPGTATAGINGPGQDVMHYIGSGPFDLQPGEKDTVAFAILAGNNLNDLMIQSTAAQNAYDCILLGQGPIQPFSISDPSLSAGEAVNFVDNNPNAISWQWDFGDGNTSNLANPQHTFATHGRYQVSLTVSDGICQFSSEQSLSVGFSTDIELENQLDWQVYPNPTKGQLVIEGAATKSGFAELHLYNLVGQEVWHYQWQHQSGAVRQELQLPVLPAGFYTLKLFNAAGQTQTILQIQK
ncbi:MAG: S8 family serine peptidase [Bacteroidota bacterium]